MVKLLKKDQSPPARASMMAIAALGVEVELVDTEIIRSSKEFIEEQLEMKRSNVIATPVLEDPPCTVIDGYEILPYLGKKFGKEDSTLYPKDEEKRKVVDERMMFDTGILFPKVCSATHPVFEEGKSGPSEEDLKEIEEAYGYLEQFLSESKFLAGDDITLADIAVIADITTLAIVAPLDAAKYPKSQAWIEEMQKQSYVEQYNKPGLELFEKMYNEKRGA